MNITVQGDISTPKLEKSASGTYDSISMISEESDSSPKDSASTSSGIPPMPIRQMKDLSEHTNLDSGDDKFPKGEVKKETGASEPKSPQLTGFKDTSEKGPTDPTQVVLTKEELKNRELEKVEKEYREKQQKLGEGAADQQHPTSPKEPDSMSISSSGSISKKQVDESRPTTTANKAAGLASLTAELSAVEGEAKAQMKTSEVKPTFFFFCFLFFWLYININVPIGDGTEPVVWIRSTVNSW